MIKHRQLPEGRRGHTGTHGLVDSVLANNSGRLLPRLTGPEVVGNDSPMAIERDVERKIDPLDAGIRDPPSFERVCGPGNVELRNKTGQGVGDSREPFGTLQHEPCFQILDLMVPHWLQWRQSTVVIHYRIHRSTHGVLGNSSFACPPTIYLRQNRSSGIAPGEGVYEGLRTANSVTLPLDPELIVPTVLLLLIHDELLP